MVFGYCKIDMIQSKFSSSSRIQQHFSESDQSGYQEISTVSHDFNHPSEDYVNFISTGEHSE